MSLYQDAFMDGERESDNSWREWRDEQAATIADLRAQRDALLEACRNMANLARKFDADWRAGDFDDFDAAINAIAKCEPL